MIDAQYKAVTTKIKALADVRKIAIDDTDSIIRAFPFNVHNDEERPHLEGLTAEEKNKFVQVEAKLVAEPERRGLDAAVDAEAEVPLLSVLSVSKKYYYRNHECSSGLHHSLQIAWSYQSLAAVQPYTKHVTPL
jgi:hypothetical protein